MIRLYIEPAVINGTIDHVIHWTLGWLYRHGYAFSYQEYDYSDGWSVDVYTRGLEPVVDVFEFVLGGFGDAFRYFVDEIGAEIEAVVVCNNRGDECFDVWFEDLKRLEDEEYLEVEERWQRMMEFVYGEDDDPEYIEYKEAVDVDYDPEVRRWERLVGLRDDGGMIDVALEQEDYE